MSAETKQIIDFKCSEYIKKGPHASRFMKASLDRSEYFKSSSENDTDRVKSFVCFETAWKLAEGLVSGRSPSAGLSLADISVQLQFRDLYLYYVQQNKQWRKKRLPL